MKRERAKIIGTISVDGRSFQVTYDIPGIHDGASDIAGGDIWFERKDGCGLNDTSKFRLETVTGAVVQGALIRVRGSHASVIVEPS